MSENEPEAVEESQASEPYEGDGGLNETPDSGDGDEPEAVPFEEPADGGDPDSADVGTETDLEPADSDDHSEHSEDESDDEAS